MTNTGFPPAVRDIVVNRSMESCEICGAGRVAEIHHRRPRGSGGSRDPETNRASNALGLCRDCHRMCESYRRVAELMGWLVSQRNRPSAEPVMYRGLRSFLHDDGSVTPAPVWLDE